MLLDELGHYFCGRSSSAAKKAEARRRIAFARHSSPFSCSNVLIYARSAVDIPAASPASISA